jgi:hypothetical protein
MSKIMLELDTDIDNDIIQTLIRFNDFDRSLYTIYKIANECLENKYSDKYYLKSKIKEILDIAMIAEFDKEDINGEIGL